MPLTLGQQDAAIAPLAQLLYAVAKRAFEPYRGRLATCDRLDIVGNDVRQMLALMAERGIFGYFGIWTARQMLESPHIRATCETDGRMMLHVDPLVAWLLRGPR